MLKNPKSEKECLNISRELKIINKKNNFIKVKIAKGTAVVLTAAAVLSLLGLISKQGGLEIVKKASADYAKKTYSFNPSCFDFNCFTCVCVDVGCVCACVCL